MPHTLQIDRRAQRVRIDYHGLVTAHEYFHVIEELAELDGFGPRVDGISVFLGAEVEIEPQQVHDVLRRLERRIDFGGRRWAFVIEEPRQVAIGLLYQLAAKGTHEVQVFATIEVATEWLDSGREAAE